MGGEGKNPTDLNEIPITEDMGSFERAVRMGLKELREIVGMFSETVREYHQASVNMRKAADAITRATHAFNEAATTNNRAARKMSEAAETIRIASSKMQR